MPFRLVCPNCGHVAKTGSVDFPFRGTWEGWPVYRCRECGVGLKTRPKFLLFGARAEVLEPATWSEVSSRWADAPSQWDIVGASEQAEPDMATSTRAPVNPPAVPDPAEADDGSSERASAEVIWSSPDDRVHRRSVTSGPDLERALDELARHAVDPGPPFIATIVRPTGEALTVGLGRPEVPLTYVGADPADPYYVSVDPRVAISTASPVEYRDGSRTTEFLAAECVASDVARQAVGEFVDTGEPPRLISWRDT